MSGNLKGWPSNQKNDLGTAITSDFVSVSPINPFQHGLESAAKFVYRVNAIQTAGVGTGFDEDTQKNWVVNTATAAKVGDVVRFETGALSSFEIPIVAVETNRFQLPIKNPAANGDTFYILRRASLRTDDSGSLTVVSGPTQFVLNGVDTQVSQDTVTPANSIPFPIQYLNLAGVRTALATEAKQDNIITELQAIKANQTNTNGSYVQQALTGIVASTIVPPANATGFYIQAPSTNAQAIRFCVGAVASDTNGVYMEQGRSEGPFNMAANISVCAVVGGANEAIVQWILSS